MPDFDLYSTDLDRLNSLTKYPSIPTYHPMGEKGRLTEECLLDPAVDWWSLTEKLDGTNVRIIFTPDGRVLLGSRENLLWSLNDLLYDPALRIVPALRDDARRWNDIRLAQSDPRYGCFVLYGELFGGKIGAACKNYTGSGRVAFSAFDVQFIHPEQVEWLRTKERDELASWREGNNQDWVTVRELDEVCGLLAVERVPHLRQAAAGEVPTGLAETQVFLQGCIQKSQALLDEGAQGRPEGVILRSSDRKRIYKLRFEDYERTLKPRR